jgi:hypothetical protein
MKTLSRSGFDRAKEIIFKRGREIEKSIFENLFYNGTRKSIVDSVRAFQNEDGGFGNGLESDFRMIESSPMATSIGIRLLKDLDDRYDASDSIQRAIVYLEGVFDENRSGWWSVSKKVNDYPHTPWWEFDIAKNSTVIDASWGNPTAEIIAYFYRYRKYVKKLDARALKDIAIEKLLQKEEFKSEHEIYCYIKLYYELDEEDQRKIEGKIEEAVDKLLIRNRKKWEGYVPRPLDFVKAPDHKKFGVETSLIEAHINQLLDELEQYGKISPSWGDSYYEGDFKGAYHEWEAKLTLETLRILSRYGYIKERDLI